MGDHIRFCRIKRKMTQGQVAKIIGVTVDTITNWELGRSKPMKKYIKRIVYFLGFAPIPNEKTLV